MKPTAPVCAGILIGGRSERMGQPKHLLPAGERTWLEQIAAMVEPFVEQVVLLGANQVPPNLRTLPVLADAPRRSGPIAGMLAAMCWRPESAWLFLACDLPQIVPAAVEWLLRQRTSGVWVVMPRLRAATNVEPLFACYEHEARALLEVCDAPSQLAGFAGVVTPEPPEEIAAAWANVNAPRDWRCSLRLER